MAQMWDNEQVLAELLARREEEYQVFSAGLLPGTEHLLGVRIPALRKLAAKIAKADWRVYLETASDAHFEEIMLQGMVIALAKMELAERLERTAWFVPKIDNWSVCDVFCAGLKCAKTRRAEVWAFLQPYFEAEETYALRFAAVMALDHFVEEAYLEPLFARFDAMRKEQYYVQMAVAWALSVCCVKFPARTMAYLRDEHSLDAFTYRKTLQKILESYRVSAALKEEVRALRSAAK